MAKTYIELQGQIAKLQQEAEALRKKEASDVLARIKEAIAVYGFTAQDLGVASSASSGASTPRRRTGGSRSGRAPKFKDGQGNVWSGRGPRPAWFKAALAAGRSADDFKA